MNTIDKFLTNSSKSYPEKLALIDENSKFAFLELEEKVKKFSSFLNQFPEKSVISLLFDNTSEFVISYFGIINSIFTVDTDRNVNVASCPGWNVVGSIMYDPGSKFVL